ncbi:MAG: 2-oxo acid dehydrogenase subunit E2 [Deltaproteobacteria bacterium]|nr:2-oxo acid dehydrogenase subunit E2 [Deltaproteobacteria bacterium]
MSTRRKLAIATWNAPREGSIFGRLTVNATALLAYLEGLRHASGEKVTITHLVGKAIAEALRHAPSLNGRISLGRFVPHETIDIAFLVAMEEGADLAKAKVASVDKKSVVDIARELRAMAERLRRRRDQDFEKSTNVLRWLPTWIIKPLTRVFGWLSGALGISARMLGLERFPFGSCIVTNVGMFGIDEGFAPLVPFAHVPMVVLVGAVSEKPAVVDGHVVAQPQLTLTATIDHRYIEGYHLATVARVVKDHLENPDKFAS